MDLRTPIRPWVRPPSFIFGCLWIAAALAVFIGCFVNNYRNTPMSPAEEMGIASAALEHQHAIAPVSPRQAP